MNGACPPREALERMLASELGEAEERALDHHVAGCDACQRRLDELTRLAPSILAVKPSANGDRDKPKRSGSVLVQLAKSSSPALRFGQQESPEKKPLTQSAVRWPGGSSSIWESGRLLGKQFWIWPLIAAALLGGAGWWVHRSVEAAMREQRVSELNTVLEADVAALDEWMDKQRTTAQLIASDDALIPLVKDLLVLSDGTPEARNRLVRAPSQTAIRSRLADRLAQCGYRGFLLVSPDGIAVAVDDDAPVGSQLNEYRRDFFTTVIRGQAAVSKPFASSLMLADEHGELRADQPTMYAAAPIRDEDGHQIAALGFRIQPDDQFTQILRVARSGKTGETYAFDRDGLLLSQSRFDDDLKQMGLLVDRPESRSILSVVLHDPGVNLMEGERPTTRRADQQLTRMARAAVQGEDGHDADGYRDYRGVPVVGAWKWLDDYDFGVTTEVDVAEAFAPLYVLRRTFAVLMGLLAAASVGILLAMLYIARQQRKLRAATVAAQQFGQYTLVERLGSGGMGTVYKARHATLRRPTAVKLLHAEKISAVSLARFEREVQLTSALTHSNTVGIYDYGSTPEGIFYYAMEYLEGVNLDDLVMRYGPLAEERVVYILRQVCASLSEAHAAGLIHRDVKPANIFLTVRGGEHDFVKVLDFGLAKLAGDRGEVSVTSARIVAGTPLYVSPEGITHPERVDARADVYAIGAVGYFLLTGSPVFTAAAVEEICMMHLSATPEPPSARSGRPVTADLEALLLCCLAKSPSDRPDDAGELLRRLEMCRIPGRWTPADATRWWAEHKGEQAAAEVPLGAEN